MFEGIEFKKISAGKGQKDAYVTIYKGGKLALNAAASKLILEINSMANSAEILADDNLKAVAFKPVAKPKKQAKRRFQFQSIALTNKLNIESTVKVKLYIHDGMLAGIL